MRTHAFRLARGDDLMASIENFVAQHRIGAGVVLSGVGCLYQAVVRNAGGKDFDTVNDDVEIVSLTGTLSPDGCHIHISFSDEQLRTYGGHLVHGCLVNTTAEIVLLELEGHRFRREHDDATGYDELVIARRGKETSV